MLTHADRALGAYGDPQLDADGYNVHARIEQALGDVAAAEKSFQRALGLRPAHADAFSGLLALLRSQQRFADYKRNAAAFIALDYANTYPFNTYLDHVKGAGVVEADRELGRELAARTYLRGEEVGAVFYGLGQLAELDGDRAQAHGHYLRSREALRKLKTPPPGSLDALEALIERTRPEP